MRSIESIAVEKRRMFTVCLLSNLVLAFRLDDGWIELVRGSEACERDVDFNRFSPASFTFVCLLSFLPLCLNGSDFLVYPITRQTPPAHQR